MISFIPLIPANAGTQMANDPGRSRRRSWPVPAIWVCDLGPGIRRDERVFQ